MARDWKDLTDSEKKKHIYDALSWFKQSELIDLIFDSLSEEGFKFWGESYDGLEDYQKYK